MVCVCKGALCVCMCVHGCMWVCLCELLHVCVCVRVHCVCVCVRMKSQALPTMTRVGPPSPHSTVKDGVSLSSAKGEAE